MRPPLEEPPDDEDHPVSPARLGEFRGGVAGNFRRLVGGARASDRQSMDDFSSRLGADDLLDLDGRPRVLFRFSLALSVPSGSLTGSQWSQLGCSCRRLAPLETSLGP